MSKIKNALLTFTKYLTYYTIMFATSKPYFHNLIFNLNDKHSL